METDFDVAVCDNCGIQHDIHTMYFNDDTGEELCGDCLGYDEDYQACEDCGMDFLIEEMVEVGGKLFCYECTQENEAN